MTGFIEQLAAKIAEQPSSEAITELQNALEELKMAEETLYEQNAAMEEVLRRVEVERRRYVELFELAPDGYCVTDAGGVIQEVNRSMCDLIGCEPGGVIGKPLMVFVPRDGRREVRSFITKMANQTPGPQSGYPLVWQTQFLLRREREVPVSARCSVSRAPSGKVVAIRWLLEDITERKRMEELARLHQDNLERAVREKTSELQEKLEELEAFHDVAVDRELRLMDLERKLHGIEEGRPV